MKTIQLFSLVIFVICTFSAFGQKNEVKSCLWTIEGKKKTHEVGLYGTVSGQYTELFKDPSFWLGARVGFVFNHKWVVGIAGHALNYDHKLTEFAENGHYRLEGGHSGMFVEYLQPFGKRIKLGARVLTGRGVVQYRFDKQTAESLEWYEEFLDRDNYAVFQPELSLYFNVGGKWWAAAEASYTTTSPVHLKGADEDFLESVNYGLSISYGIF
jgi:hypothetical protein